MFDWKDIEHYEKRSSDDAYTRFTFPLNLAAAFERSTLSSGIFFQPPVQILGDKERFKYPPRTAQNDFIHQIVNTGASRVVGWRTLVGNDNIYNDEFSGAEALKRVAKEGTSGYFEGYILEPGGSPVDHYSLVVRNSTDVQHLPGKTYFVGSLEPSNYGSFLLRTLPKLLHLRNIIQPEDNLLLSTEYPWVQQFISLLGIKAKLVNMPRTAHQITLEQGYLVTSSYNEGFLSRDTLRSLKELIAPLPTGQVEKLWISRRFRAKQAPNYRPLMNEEELIDIAKAEGFTVVEMENLSVVEQISIMKGGKVIAGPSGSGLLNSIFAPAGTKVIELESFTWCIRQHGKVYSSCGHPYTEIFGEFDEEDKRDQVTRRWRVSAAILKNGLISSGTNLP